MSDSSCFISLCMIVKNEEDNILSCLTSVKDAVDEMVIVDTGSEDRTLQIIEEYGAHLHIYPWQNDFAAARNYALSKANGQWILVLDADESLDESATLTLRNALATSEEEGFYLGIHNYQGSENNFTWTYALRLFRNNPLYRYEGRIHEQIFPSIKKANPQVRIGWSPWIIHHYGYSQDMVFNKNKAQRNLMILLSETPETKASPFFHLNLAMEYLRLAKVAEAEVWLKEGWRRVDTRESYAHRLLIKLITCLHLQNKDKEALAYCNEGLRKYPNYPDLYYYYGICLMRFNDLRQARVALLKGLQKDDNPRKYISESGCGSYLNLFALGQIEEQCDNYELALDYYLKALRLHRNSLPFLKSLIRALLKSNLDMEAYLVEQNLLREYLAAIIKILFSLGNYSLVLEIISDSNEVDGCELRKDVYVYGWMCALLEEEFILAQKYAENVKACGKSLSNLLVTIQDVFQNGLQTDNIITLKEFKNNESVLTILSIIDNFASCKRIEFLDPVIGLLLHISGEDFKLLLIEILDKRQCYEQALQLLETTNLQQLDDKEKHIAISILKRFGREIPDLW